MKPVLYHDIDGVLFGDYAGEFQLRPAVKTWLNWAHEHFSVVWLTTWRPDEIKNLLNLLHCEKYIKSFNLEFRYANWYQSHSKEEWLSAHKDQLAEVEWFWIDDDVPSTERLHSLGLDPIRCISVSPKGQYGLQDVTLDLEGRLDHIGTGSLLKSA